MKAKLAGLILGTGMSLMAQAATYNFTPITGAGNPALDTVASQLTMTVTDGGADNVLFTFTNNGSIESSISRVYFDDSPSNLFASFSVADQSAGVNFSLNASPSNLTGGAQTVYAFSGTDSAGALRPPIANGINNNADTPGEFLTMSAVLNAGKTFADVISSLGSGSETNGDFLRVGLRVLGIEGFRDSSAASFLDKGNGSGSPSPIPEPTTYGMLLAGMGLMTAIARRRQSKR